MRKSIFNKKVIMLDEGKYIAKFRNEEDLLKYYKECEEKSFFVNERGNPKSWQAYCHRGNFSVKPDVNNQVIYFTELY